MCASLIKAGTEDSIRATCHILSANLLYQLSLRGFLAEREIIANALLIVRISPRTDGKGTKIRKQRQMFYRFIFASQ